MKKYQVKIKNDIGILKAKNLIEANTKIVFSEYRTSFKYEDEDISLSIGTKPCITSNEWHYLGKITEFDLEKFLNILPTKYWLALHRDRQIESILE